MATENDSSVHVEPTDPKCQGCGVVTLHRFRNLTLCTDCEREIQKMALRDVFGIGPNEMFSKRAATDAE